MTKLLSRIIWILAFIPAVLFLVANRQPVSISLDPFSASAPAVTTWEFPLWFWLMLMLFIGFAAGAAGMWVSGRPKRQKARLEHRELKALRKELAAVAMESDQSKKAQTRDEEAGKTSNALEVA